jgi:excinuclease UvrABC ATPase subunit
MCPECEGLGRTLRPDLDLMLDRTRSLDEGAILLSGYPVGSPGWQLYARRGRLDPAKRLSEYSEEELHTLLHGSGGTVELTFASGKTQRLKYEGLLDSFTRRHLKRDVGALREKTRAAGERFLSEGACPACGGASSSPAGSRGPATSTSSTSRPPGCTCRTSTCCSTC